jgi:hypothetical protein
MNRLNAFAQFESKKETHEDTLTRAFLVVLRLVPQAHERFLSLVAAKRTSPPALPNLSVIDRNSVVFETQTGSFAPAARLLSILLTDSHFEETISVAAHSRTPIYDGVIGYAQDWVFIIENKPRHENVWKDQLSPSAKDVQDTEVEDTAVILEWKAVVQELAALVEGGALEPAANGLVTDFLDFVYENFPFLNPYEKLALCKHDKGLLDNRCRLAMESIVPGRVLKHRNWGYYMKFDDGPSRQVKLDAEGTDAQLKLVLSVHPGDTVDQARQLYDALSVELLSKLQTKGWQVEPNFHLAFIRQGVFRSKGTIPLADYIAVWQNCRMLIRKMPVGPESEDVDFRTVVASFARLKLVSENEIACIFELTSKHKTINICPGLSLYYRWPLIEAVDLDKRGVFVDDVRARLQEAFDAWGQRI